MSRFDKYIREARPVVDDPEDFWRPRGWLSREGVEELNEMVANGEVTTVRSSEHDDGWLINVGLGHVFEVEVASRCPFCGDPLDFDTTADDGTSCRYPSCRRDQADDESAGW